MEYEIRPVGRFSLNLKELWSYRELIYSFTLRDIKIKYKQTVVGAAWVIFQPLLLMLVFTFFFSRTLKIPSNGLPYPLFVFSGLMLWTLFSTGVINATQSMVSNANIIKKIYFPRLIVPLSTVLSALVDFLASFLFYLALLIYYDKASVIPQLLLIMPLSILIVFLTATGLGSMFSAMSVKYRDVKYIIPFMVQVLLFLTPVIYPVTLLGGHWTQSLLELNPLSGAIAGIRAVVSETNLPFNEMMRSLCVAVLIFSLGIFYFRKTEYYFADVA